jgi:hypothetical protein
MRALVFGCALTLCTTVTLLAGCATKPFDSAQPFDSARGDIEVCPRVAAGEARCVLQIADPRVGAPCSQTPCGWHPADLQLRYKLPIGRGAGQIVAAIDPYDLTTASADLSTYRTEFGLGTANFVKYNQKGKQRNYPANCADYYYGFWCLTEDNDLEMISAICPRCTIYLIEANSGKVPDLEAAVREAVALGAHIVNNSWGCSPAATCADPKDFEARGVTYLGPEGTTVQAPSVFKTVVAVGGTQLAKTGSTYSESVWSGAFGECATDLPKPQWQSVIPKSVCAYRMTNDVAAQAGCQPGVADFIPFEGGWVSLCGTSVATPIISGIFGLAGSATKQDGGRTFWEKRHRKDLYAISGQCYGSGGYEQGKYKTCTGWGSPRGIGAFSGLR